MRRHYEGENTIRLKTPMVKFPGVLKPQPVNLGELGNQIGQGAAFKALTSDEALQIIAAQLSTQILRRSMIPRQITVTATPQQVILAKSLKGYLILNPSSSLSSGISTSGTLLASTHIVADGNTQATPLGVANYRSAHLYLNISVQTSVAPATIDIWTQSQDPVSLNWANVSNVFPNADTGGLVGTYYAYIGPDGLASNLALRWETTNAPDYQLSVGYVLKESLPGSASGLSRTIYLGPNSAVTTTSGFPLLEAQSWQFFMEMNCELWAVSSTPTTLNIFELQ